MVRVNSSDPNRRGKLRSKPLILFVKPPTLLGECPEISAVESFTIHCVSARGNRVPRFESRPHRHASDLGGFH